MQWLRSKPALAIPEVESVDECAALMKRDLVILFKHSPSCPVSWVAHREVMKFLGSQPQSPVFLISVRKRRDVAHYIAEHTSVRHESPQIVVLRYGKVIGDASHDNVTAQLLQRLAVEHAEAQVPTL